MFNHALAGLTAALTTPIGLLAVASAIAASALVVSSHFVKTMIPLRWLGVGGNIGFFIYGALYPSYVMMMLHAVLLPINIYRASEMVRLARRARAASAAGDVTGVWLQPYMKKNRMKAGEVLFRKGDPASHMYFLAEGRIEFVEIQTTMEPGRIFGEIAFFAPDNRRTLTARCIDDCLVLAINGSTVKQLYFQNPAFGFEVVSLIARRLSTDVQRLEKRLAEVAAATRAPEAERAPTQPLPDSTDRTPA